MIFNFRKMTFSDDDWKYIILQYLKEWTEIPLNPNCGYDIEELKFFDGFLGTLLKQTEFFVKECPSEVNKEFVDSWKYQGKLYRVMHSHYVFNDNSIEPRIVMPKVNYHRMITHWTDDYTFEGLMYKLSDDEEYIHNSTVSRTERAIRYAVESGYDNCRMCGIDTFKRVCFSNGKPSNNEFLKSLYLEYEFTDK